jgi:hypothetical protein
MLALSAIRLDDSTQPLAVFDKNLIEEYTVAMIDGATFPPVIVFYDGQDYWRADGYHRHLRAPSANRSEIHDGAGQASKEQEPQEAGACLTALAGEASP